MHIRVFSLWVYGGLFVALVTRILFVMMVDQSSRYDVYDGQRAVITGIVASEPDIRDTSQKLTVHITSADVSSVENARHGIHASNVLVTTNTYSEWRYGDIVRVTGVLSRPKNFTGDTQREFDYINYLGKSDIHLEVRSARVELIEHGGGGLISSALLAFKRMFLNNIRDALPEPHASLAGGLVVGGKQSLGSELLDDFRIAGLVHIVVLSGYNVSIVVNAILRSLFFMPRMMSLFSGVGGIFLFAIIAGGGATVWRACTMAVVAILARLLYRPYSALRALVIAGYVMIFINPLTLFHDPSFQLSFLATLGLITMSPMIESWCSWCPEKLGIRTLVATTLATQIFTTPYLIYFMGTISIAGIVTNFFVPPIIPLAMLLIFFVGMLGFVTSLGASIVGTIVAVILEYVFRIVDIAASSSISSFTLPPVPSWSIWLSYIVLVAWVGHWHYARWKRDRDDASEYEKSMGITSHTFSDSDSGSAVGVPSSIPGIISVPR